MTMNPTNKKILSTVRDPKKAETLLKRSCELNHAPSCHNLAVMYKLGDINVLPDPQKFEVYRARTLELQKIYGGVGGTRAS